MYTRYLIAEWICEKKISQLSALDLNRGWPVAEIGTLGPGLAPYWGSLT